jgi:asparaginyl-tRNA synthetase
MRDIYMWLSYRTSNTRDAKDRGEGESVRLIGWIASKRIHGKKIFMNLRDRYGYIQLVAREDMLPPEKFSLVKKVNIESAVAVEGVVKKDPRAPGGAEIHLTDFIVVSPADEWPITLSALKSPGFLFDMRHLTLRGPRSRTIMLIRAEMLRYMIEYFLSNDYVWIQAPTFITAAVEGGATLFPVKYFDKVVYLTQSAQFYEEAAICAFEKVFVVQPSFRSEKSRTRKHLTEFWHVEAEVAFATHDDILRVEEELIYYVTSKLVESMGSEIEMIRGSAFKPPEPPFDKIRYDEAISMLQSRGIDIEWGEDFGSEAERELSRQFEKPFFITHFPVETRSFYHMDDPSNPEVTLSSDLYAPEGYGEITSGGQRIHEYDKLYEKIKRFGLNPEDYKWYLELRRYGMPPHSGFGIGVERTLRWILKLSHIRESTLFPRTPSRVYP